MSVTKEMRSSDKLLLLWSRRLLLILTFSLSRDFGAHAQPVTVADTNAVSSQASWPAPTNSPTRSKFIDPEDGYLDVSEFLDTAYGFVPLVMPITEPAIGYGAGGGLIFIDRNEPAQDGQMRKPNITAVGGAGTDNGTWATFAAHAGSWLEGKLETTAFVGYGSVNLDFYGIGDGPLNQQPLGYHLEPLGGMVEGRYRLGKSSFQAGLRYGYGKIDASFDAGTLPPGVTPTELNSTVSGISPTLTYDSRNNLFTPTKGIYAQASVNLNREVLGSDFNFEIVDLIFIYYWPLASKLTLGAKVEANFSFNDVPFYARPYIGLRGAPAFRYLGEHAVDLELEARWQLWRRFSLIGFAGTGTAWNDFDNFQSEQSIVTGGFGFRYEIARKHGLHMGIDAAFGPDDPAIYVQFGSAWLRP